MSKQPTNQDIIDAIKSGEANIIVEIKQSRQENSDEHVKILGTAASADNTIQKFDNILDKVSAFFQVGSWLSGAFKTFMWPAGFFVLWYFGMIDFSGNM